MKCIIKAMAETEYRPRAKWWGFVHEGHRFLMRYHHCWIIFSETKPIHINYETRTDKEGVLFALKYFKEQLEAKQAAEQAAKLENPGAEETPEEPGTCVPALFGDIPGIKPNQEPKA
jgi:hypothetical protein